MLWKSLWTDGAHWSTRKWTRRWTVALVVLPMPSDLDSLPRGAFSGALLDLSISASPTTSRHLSVLLHFALCLPPCLSRPAPLPPSKIGYRGLIDHEPDSGELHPRCLQAPCHLFASAAENQTSLRDTAELISCDDQPEGPTTVFLQDASATMKSPSGPRRRGPNTASTIQSEHSNP